MIIDSHTHVMLPTEKQISMMEEAKIDKTILFSTTPHPERAHDLKSLESELSVLNNILSSNTSLSERIKNIKSTTKILKEVIDKNPSKFIGFGSVPLSLTYNETADWINDNIIKNNFYGLGEFSPMSGKINSLEVIFQASNELGCLPIWVHTFYPLNFQDIKGLVDLSKKYPKVPLILGHMGGTHWLDVIKIAKENHNIYLDVSATYTTLAPTLAIKELPERTLFSSDAPYGNPLLFRKMIEIYSPDTKTAEQVLGGNIERLLNL
ncbi:amidohydrolase family protein [Clostridium sp. P21]|uniref:Amidohydrolase family protein n=1 Tax=Clostridium muellerianum TaxID=2716538 RepID=A0A7Y0HR38_9CLOT|nr:amidohydrolase family protein [Clostridium muellerianum]NMM64786.1 amidohydrolase family protein [Clostridium muellerianum]